MNGNTMEIRLKYVVEDTDRHDNVRLYYRRKGFPKVRLPGPIGSPAFLAAYKAAAENAVSPTPKILGKIAPLKPGTVRWLCVQYYKSAMFNELDPRSMCGAAYLNGFARIRMMATSLSAFYSHATCAPAATK